MSFARPGLLFLILLPLLLLPLARLLRRRQHRTWQRLGQAAMLQRHVLNAERSPLRRQFLLVLAGITLCIAVAGPRWGVSDEAGIAVGRDVVLVLDFSRSMWAEDISSRDAPARWQAAIQAARDLVQASKLRGGNRLALIIFAAQPLVIAPLTTDADHLLLKLDTLNARTPPAEIRPSRDDAISGTRIGAALKAAIELHDTRFPGSQEIVLITDADDPAQDGEWHRGVDGAREAKIPVHVVGLGDATRDAFILKNGEPLEGPLGQVQTHLHEDVARAIALESRGEYIAAGTELPRMQELSQRSALREVSDEHRPQPRDQSQWFYLATLFVCVFAWASRDRLVAAGFSLRRDDTIPSPQAEASGYQQEKNPPPPLPKREGRKKSQPL